jgi:UDP-GlcNAc:undecaprenyl-phosphate GlcNAc-1-phosphate transferase
MEPLELAIPLVAAFGVAAVSTPWVARFALAVGAVDRPNERKISQRDNMPLLGGLAVAAGFATALTLALAFGPSSGIDPTRVRGLALGAFIILVVGFVDDRFGLGARAKLAGQLLAAAVAIQHGFMLFYLTNPFTLELLEVPESVMWIATAFWIVAITNAVNLLDGLDGLASGVVVIIATTLSVIAWQAGHPLGLWVGVALVGGLLGFLPHNFSPARIFLGDTGSLFCGFILSLMALECFRRVSMITLTVPLLTLAVPLLDTSLSIVRRLRSGAPIFSADRMHMHHRLLASEGSARAAVLQFYLLTSAFCLIALSFARLEGIWAIGFMLAVVGLTIRLLMNLGLMDLHSEDRAPEVGTNTASEDHLGDEDVDRGRGVGEGEA